MELLHCVTMCSEKKTQKHSDAIPPIKVIPLPKFTPRLDITINKLYNERMEAKRRREEEEKSLDNLTREINQTQETEHRTQGFEEQLHRTVSHDMNSRASTIHWL